MNDVEDDFVPVNNVREDFVPVNDVVNEDLYSGGDEHLRESSTKIAQNYYGTLSRKCICKLDLGKVSLNGLNLNYKPTN